MKKFYQNNIIGKAQMASNCKTVTTHRDSHWGRSNPNNLEFYWHTSPKSQKKNNVKIS